MDVPWYVGFVSKNSLPSASCKNGMSLAVFLGGSSHGHYAHPLSFFSPPYSCLGGQAARRAPSPRSASRSRTLRQRLLCLPQGPFQVTARRLFRQPPHSPYR